MCASRLLRIRSRRSWLKSCKPVRQYERSHSQRISLARTVVDGKCLRDHAWTGTHCGKRLPEYCCFSVVQWHSVLHRSRWSVDGNGEYLVQRVLRVQDRVTTTDVGIQRCG